MSQKLTASNWYAAQWYHDIILPLPVMYHVTLNIVMYETYQCSALLTNLTLKLFTVRHYASAVYPMALHLSVCLSVCLSVISQYYRNKSVAPAGCNRMVCLSPKLWKSTHTHNINTVQQIVNNTSQVAYEFGKFHFAVRFDVLVV